MYSNCVPPIEPIELDSKFTCTSWTQEQDSVCHGLIFPLIKFTLPVSSTPGCDE